MIHIEDIGSVRRFRLARNVMGRGLYFTAAYWVDGLMIDTGCAYTVKELVSALDGVKVALIVNTHSHEDHIGANATLKKRFGTEIMAHPLALTSMALPPKHQTLHPYQVVMWGYPTASFGVPIGDTIETEHHHFQIIHTPGHSPDHICFFEPHRGWLFAGDAYIGGRDQAMRADYNIWQIIGSLKMLAKLDTELLFTGSGSVRENPRLDLTQKIDYLEGTGAKILELHRQGFSYPRIRRKIFGRELPISYFTLGHFSGKHLVRSFLEDRLVS
jgi:glyoxylase-like metal-dependent hydrolase (beta-lactamase superfamily II)